MPDQAPTELSAAENSRSDRTRGDEDLRRLDRCPRGRLGAGLAADFRSSKHQIGESHVLHCQRHHSRRCRPLPCRDGWPAACRAGGVAPNLATASSTCPSEEVSDSHRSLNPLSSYAALGNRRWWRARGPGPRRPDGGPGHHGAQRGAAHAVQGTARVGVGPPVVLFGILACAAAAMLPAGLLGDRYGRKAVLLTALALFGAGSAACGVFDLRR